MFLPFEGNTPAWYELGLTDRGFRIDVHPEVISQLGMIHPETVEEIRSWRNLPEHVHTETEFGFGRCLIKQPSRFPTWTAFEVILPDMSVLDDFWAVTTESYTPLYSITGSLHLLTVALKTVEGPFDTSRMQLITVDELNVAPRDCYQAAISVKLAPALFPWIQSQPDKEPNRNASSEIYKAYKQMHPKGGRDSRDCRLVIKHPKYFYINIPGYAVGLDPRYWNGELNRPSEMEPHNTESPEHQLLILVGLASVHDQARKAGF